MSKLSQDDQLQGEIEAAARTVADLLNDDLLSQGIRMVALGDWIERLAVWAVAERQGEGEVVAKFLLDCLGLDNLDIVEEYDGETPLVDPAGSTLKSNPEL